MIIFLCVANLILTIITFAVFVNDNYIQTRRFNIALDHCDFTRKNFYEHFDKVYTCLMDLEKRLVQLESIIGDE